MKTTNLMNLVERLIKANEKLDAVRRERSGNTTPIRYRVKPTGQNIEVWDRYSARGRWYHAYTIEPSGVLWLMYLRRPEQTTIVDQLRKVRGLIVQSRRWNKSKRLQLV